MNLQRYFHFVTPSFMLSAVMSIIYKASFASILLSTYLLTILFLIGKILAVFILGSKFEQYSYYEVGACVMFIVLNPLIENL